MQILAIIGMWSEAEVGPGVRCTLWNASLLVNAMSGVVAAFALMNVGKWGPMCMSLSLLRSRSSTLPTLFLSL